MAERQIKRNGRGQIVSYEIFGALDSAIESDSYGKSIFNTTGEIGTKVTKFNELSFNDTIDVSISDELRRPLNEVSANVALGDIALNFIVPPSSNTGGGV